MTDQSEGILLEFIGAHAVKPESTAGFIAAESRSIGKLIRMLFDRAQQLTARGEELEAELQARLCKDRHNASKAPSKDQH